MTPSHQPQQEYYLIKRDEWNTLYNMDQNDFVIDLLERVRSRPNTSPPAPAPFDLDDDRMYTSVEVKAAYAAAAKAAREQYAEELKKDLKSRFVSQSNQWCKGRNSGLIECCNIIDESLRAQQEQP